MAVAGPVVAAALWWAPGAAAQTIPSPFRYVEETQSASVFAGYVITDRGDVDLGPHSAPLLGGSYNIRFAGPVSGEAIVALAPSSRTIYRPAEGEEEGPLTEIGETRALLAVATAGLKLHLTGPRTWRGIAPFAAAGLGFTSDLAGSPDEEKDLSARERFEFGPSFAVSVGAGTDWFPSERFALRIEARDVLWRLTTPAGLAPQGQETTDWVHNLAITLGAALFF